VLRDPLPGDLVVFQPHFSHIGIVTAIGTAHGTPPALGYISPIEGNTNGAGEREGVAVCAKLRPLSLCGSFIRLLPRAARA
jgi:hypothetical protein